MAAGELSSSEVAEIRALALARIPRYRLAQMIPRLLEHGDERSIDLRPRIHALVGQLHLGSAIEEETAWLYQELADAAAKRDPERYRITQDRLRELREEAARRATEYFEQRAPLKAMPFT